MSDLGGESMLFLLWCIQAVRVDITSKVFTLDFRVRLAISKVMVEAKT